MPSLFASFPIPLTKVHKISKKKREREKELITYLEYAQLLLVTFQVQIDQYYQMSSLELCPIYVYIRK